MAARVCAACVIANKEQLTNLNQLENGIFDGYIIWDIKLTGLRLRLNFATFWVVGFSRQWSELTNKHVQ